MQPVQFVEGLAIHNTSVHLHRWDPQQILDEKLQEDQVQKAGRRRHWPLANPTLDDFSVKRMSNHRGAGHLFEFCRTACVVLMCMSQGDVLDLGSRDPGLLQSAKDLVTIFFKTSIDESVAIVLRRRKQLTIPRFRDQMDGVTVFNPIFFSLGAAKRLESIDKSLGTIKRILVFFFCLTIIGMIVGFIAAISR